MATFIVFACVLAGLFGFFFPRTLAVVLGLSMLLGLGFTWWVILIIVAVFIFEIYMLHASMFEGNGDYFL